MWRQTLYSLLVARFCSALVFFFVMQNMAFADVLLRYSSWIPNNHTLRIDVFDPWARQVEKVTDGRVKVEVMPKVIGSLASQFDAVKNGIADIALVVNGYTPGRFPISEIGELPFLGDNAPITSPAYYRLYDSRLKKYGEFKGVHVLSTFTVGSGHLFTAEKKINSVEDFSGLKIRNPSGSTLPLMDQLKMIPVQKSITETYELVSTGVVDGVIMPREAVEGYKLVEILPHFLQVPGGLYNSVLTLAVNERKWKSISEQDRESIMEISGETLAKTIGETYQRIDGRAVQAMKKNGSDVRIASPALTNNLASLLKEKVDTIWIEKAQKRGMDDAKSVLATYRKSLSDAGATSSSIGSPQE